MWDVHGCMEAILSLAKKANLDKLVWDQTRSHHSDKYEDHYYQPAGNQHHRCRHTLIQSLYHLTELDQN